MSQSASLNIVTASDFYEGKIPHPQYGTLLNIHKKLLSVEENIFFKHDFILWLFPWIKCTDIEIETSSFSPEETIEKISGAPIVTSDDLERFKEHYELRRLFNRSIMIILSYYGMQLNAESIQASENFAQAASLWLTDSDSTNLHRIILLLRSMTLLGEKHLAEEMLAILTRVQQAFPQHISIELLQKWQQAIAEGEKQFYVLYKNPAYSYSQFWQKPFIEKSISIKQLQFITSKNADLFLQLMQEKGFHPTRINDDILTLTIYEKNNRYILYLTPGQLALLSHLSFQVPSENKTMNGQELLETLLKS